MATKQVLKSRNKELAKNKEILPASWNTRARTYPRALRYIIVSGVVLFALIARVSLQRYLGNDSTFITFFGAVMISAWYGGWRAGIYATLFSLVLVDYLYLEPRYAVGVFALRERILALVFLIEGAIISGLSNSLHTALYRSEIQKRDLRESEERFGLLVKGVQDYAIYMLDPDGFIVSWNEGAERIKGYKSEEVIGKHFSIFYPKEDVDSGKPWDTLEQARLEGRAQDEGWRVKGDNTRFWANDIFTALLDERGNLRGFSKVTRDRTEARELDARKDEFISIASHELKTPLTTLKGYTQILENQFKKLKSEKSLTYLDKMDGQIDRLNKLVSELLNVSRIQMGKLELQKEEVDIDNLVKEVSEDMRHSTQIHKIEVAAKSGRKLNIDKDRFSQVLVNLINNAIRYSPQGKKICVYCELKGTEVVISVKDFGVGIPKEQQKHIFERFFQASNLRKEGLGGLGLGLYISCEIVKEHGGKLWVKSKIGKGTTFYVSLPSPTIRV
ncbi:MAG: ATP-binding protein [bacterium]|nr:ATP-binding protein [bacterium]